MRERADVSVEKTDLILALVDPREVTARVHQPHQEQPRFAAGPIDVDQDLEEVDLGEIPGTIRQRHEDLATLPLPFRDRVFHDGHAHPVALAQQQRVQPRGGQPLLAARPSHRVGQHRLDPLSDRIPHRPRPRRRLGLPRRRRLAHIFAHRRPREAQLARHCPLRPSFDEHLMPTTCTRSILSILPADPRSLDPASPLSDPQVAYFPSGVWPTF